MTLTRYLAHLPRWGVEVAVALEDGTQSPSRRRRQRLYAVTEYADHFCFGTFETCRPTLTMSVSGRRPEVMGRMT
jgi:hypothetical protein